MPAQIIEDDSIGAALGTLYKGFAAGSDPKRRAEALALQAIIDQRGAATQQTEIENINLMRQRQAQNEAIKALGTDLAAGRAKIPGMIEPDRPAPEFVGPMEPVANPRLTEFDQRLATARAIANNAILRGGSPTDAATAAWKSLGLGQVYTQGLPSSETGARELQTIIGGDIPRADVPLTEQQRAVMETEKAAQAETLKRMETNAAMERERLQQEQALIRQRQAPVVAAQNTTVLMTPEERQAKGLPAEGPIPVQRSVGPKEIVETPGRPTLRGAELPDPNAPAQTPLFQGTGEGAQAWNILNRIVSKHRSGQMLDDNDIQQYFIAKSVAFPEKSEPRIVNGQTQYVPIKTPMPRFLAIPGLVDESEIGQGVMARPDAVPVPALPAPAAEGEIPGTTPAPVPAPVGVPTMQRPTGRAGEIVEPTKQEYTEAAGKNVKFAAQMMSGDDALSAIEKSGQMPSMPAGVLSDLLAPKLGRYSKDLVRTDALKNYESAAISFLEPIIRERSGAAVLDSEYSNYHDQFIPHPSDPPELKAFKANSRKEAVKVMREVAEGTPAKEILDRVQARVGTAPRPVAAPAKPLPEGTDLARVRVRATEEKAKIDVRTDLDPAEKARRKSAIDARVEQYTQQPGVK